MSDLNKCGQTWFFLWMQSMKLIPKTTYKQNKHFPVVWFWGSILAWNAWCLFLRLDEGKVISSWSFPQLSFYPHPFPKTATGSLISGHVASGDIVHCQFFVGLRSLWDCNLARCYAHIYSFSPCSNDTIFCVTVSCGLKKPPFPTKCCSITYWRLISENSNSLIINRKCFVFFGQ